MKSGENSLMGEFKILIGVLTAGVGQNIKLLVFRKNERLASEPPHLNWSSAMFRKRRTDNDEQTTEAGRDYHEVEAS